MKIKITYSGISGSFVAANQILNSSVPSAIGMVPALHNIFPCGDEEFSEIRVSTKYFRGAQKARRISVLKSGKRPTTARVAAYALNHYEYAIFTLCASGLEKVFGEVPKSIYFAKC